MNRIQLDLLAEAADEAKKIRAALSELTGTSADKISAYAGVDDEDEDSPEVEVIVEWRGDIKHWAWFRFDAYGGWTWTLRANDERRVGDGDPMSAMPALRDLLNA